MGKKRHCGNRGIAGGEAGRVRRGIKGPLGRVGVQKGERKRKNESRIFINFIPGLSVIL